MTKDYDIFRREMDAHCFPDEIDDENYDDLVKGVDEDATI